MLFFFELFLFLLIMLTVALGEFVGGGLALGIWLASTTGSLIGYTLARRSLSTDPLDQRWARTVLYHWRRTNGLLLVGAAGGLGWYWLRAPAG